MKNTDKKKPTQNDHCPPPDKKIKESDEIKNAHATGLGAMGRSDEALPDKPEENTKVEPGDY